MASRSGMASATKDQIEAPFFLVDSFLGQHDQQTGSFPEKREAAVVTSRSRRRDGGDGKGERNFRLPTIPQPTTGLHWRWQLIPSPSSPRASSSSMLPSFGLLPLYLPHTWPPTRCTKCRLACLRLHRFLLAPGPGRHPLLAFLWSIHLLNAPPRAPALPRRLHSTQEQDRRRHLDASLNLGLRGCGSLSSRCADVGVSEALRLAVDCNLPCRS